MIIMIAMISQVLSYVDLRVIRKQRVILGLELQVYLRHDELLQYRVAVTKSNDVMDTSDKQ